MAINFNNQNQNGIGNLDLSQFGLMQPQNQNMQVADAYNTPTEGEYGFNLIELDKLKNAGYDPAELSTYPNQEDVQSIIRNLEPTSMSISNYDQLFGPKTMSDANQSLYTGVIDRSGTPIGEDIDMQYTNDSFNVEPQYRIRDQLNRDFLQGGLFKDAKNSLRETGTALNEDFGDIKGKIGAGFNNLIDNPVTRGLGTAFNFLKGNVPGMLMSGLGAIFNRDPNAPSYQQYSPQSYLKDNNLKNIYNANPSMINDFYDSNPESDDFNTTRFDRATTAFGKSRALFGPNGIAATKAKMAAAKVAKAKAYKEKQAADAITAANNPYNPDGSRAAYNYAGRDNAQGTHTSTMSNSQAQTNQDRGRGRYQNGGLASMFTRRR